MIIITKIAIYIILKATLKKQCYKKIYLKNGYNMTKGKLYGSLDSDHAIVHLGLKM